MIAVVAAAMLLTAATPPHAAATGSCKKVRTGTLKIKKIRVSAAVRCQDARSVSKAWVERGYNDLNAIARSGDLWFCSWRRRAPGSTTTGSAECDADPGEEVRFSVRKRRR